MFGYLNLGFGLCICRIVILGPSYLIILIVRTVCVWSHAGGWLFILHHHLVKMCVYPILAMTLPASTAKVNSHKLQSPSQLYLPPRTGQRNKEKKVNLVQIVITFWRWGLGPVRLKASSSINLKSDPHKLKSINQTSCYCLILCYSSLCALLLASMYYSDDTAAPVYLVFQIMIKSMSWSKKIQSNIFIRKAGI